MRSAINTWCFLVILKLTSGFERQLKATINPGCSTVICEDNSTVSIVHVSAVGPDDVIHYIWDFTWKPSILIAITPPDSVLQINCTGFCNGDEGSITFSTPTSYNFSVVINNIIEFNDDDDCGKFIEKNHTNLNILNTKYINWRLKNLINTVNHVELFISGDRYNDTNMTRDGLVSLSFKAFAHHGHDDILPCLLHTANSSQVELQLENVELDKHFNSSRFAVEFLMVSPLNGLHSVEINTKKSLDDEYAPGVFELVELVTSKTLEASKGGYVQYRPVSYTSKDRQIANSTDINWSSVTNITEVQQKLEHSIAISFYPHESHQIVLSGMNISFGTSGDGFYKNRNFTTWTFTVGYGKPPQPKFSIIVIVVICIALGTPFLMMITGALYFCCQHYIHHKREQVLS